MKKHLKFLFSSLMVLSLASCGDDKPQTQEPAEQPTVEVHEHTFSSDWSSNDGSHWHASTCGHADLSKDMADHSYSNWVEDKAATETTEGSKHRTCSVCNYTQTVGIAKTSH